MSSTRRSSRIASKRPAPIVVEEESQSQGNIAEDGRQSSPIFEPDDEDDEFEAEKPATKRRKVGASGKAVAGAPRPRRKKGKLSSLLTMMPNEVMCQICSYLLPIDLLHIVQSSKVFARFLLHASTAGVWRDARQHLEPGFPDCPGDITEQQYACLVFGRHCQRCGRPGIRQSCGVWTLRRRWCEACVYEIYHGVPDYPYVGLSPYEAHMYMFVSRVNRKARGPNYTIGIRADIDFVRAKLEALQGQGKPPDSDSEEGKELEAFREQRVAELRARELHRNALVVWISGRAVERSGVLEAVRNTRVEQLKDFLTEEGLDRALLDCITTTWYQTLLTMKQSKPLHRKGWEIIKEKIIPQINDRFTYLRNQAKSNALTAFRKIYADYRADQLPTKYFVPSETLMSTYQPFIDFAYSWAEKPGNTPRLCAYRSWNDPPIQLPMSFNAQIPALLLELRTTLERYFAECLPAYNSLKDPHTLGEMLELATSVFKGEQPGPGIHHCIPFHLTYRGFNTMPYTSHNRAFAPLEKCWTYDKVSAAILRDIIGKCGLDPANCTHEMLEEADAYVVCLPCCEDGSKYGPTMKWNQAHMHWRATHSEMHESGSSWRVLDAEEKAAFVKVWEKEHTTRAVESTYSCLMCGESWNGLQGMTMENLHRHLLGHQIDEEEARDPKYRVLNRETKSLPALLWDPANVSMVLESPAPRDPMEISSLLNG